MRPPDKFGQGRREPQPARGDDLYSQIGSNPPPPVGGDDFAAFEMDAANKRNELLFSITSQVEDTRGKLKQAELTVERLRQHLKELEDIYRTLTRGNKPKER